MLTLAKPGNEADCNDAQVERRVTSAACLLVIAESYARKYNFGPLVLGQLTVLCALVDLDYGYYSGLLLDLGGIKRLQSGMAHAAFEDEC